MQIVHRSRWIYRRTHSPTFFETLEPRRLFSAAADFSSDQQYHAWAFASLDVNMPLLKFSGDAPAGGFQFDIAWGDGTDSGGDVQSLGANNWQLDGQHHYEQAGVYNVSFVITNDGPDQDYGSWTTLAVGRDGIVSDVQNDQTPQAYGDDRSDNDGLVGFFDTGMTDDTQYRAIIDWGDGRITDGTVGTGQGHGGVLADIQYAKSGVYTATVTVQRLTADGSVAAQTSIPVNIDYEITPIMMYPSDTSNQVSYSADGHFTDSLAFFSSDKPIDQFSASIDWGDGTTSSALITATGQVDDEGIPTYSVSGDHQFAPGDAAYEIEVNLQSTAGNTGSFPRSIYVGSDRLIAHPLGEGSAQPVVWVNDPAYSIGGFGLGTLTDPASPANAQYNVSVDWGDGTTSAGSATAEWNGVYVSGDHTYAANGTYSVSVTVSRPGADGTGTVSSSYGFTFQLIGADEIDTYEQQGRWLYNVMRFDDVAIGSAIQPRFVNLPGLSPMPAPIIDVEPTFGGPAFVTTQKTTPTNIAAAPTALLFGAATAGTSLQSLLGDDHQHDLLTRPADDPA